ncbi:hypothetical protein GYMLUDRAFT_261491 [Collybiopsis luxurians FD-317 M1]|uniref:Uncharacterized protein n=1 Tax=Collybiopsis luxurians FD-317 M1 TaxID=944289 RepID=A0A0D0BXU4_9AGAR|nr:hypothetical protein GYMLUDRAFT_261491 [Collybiopsis luxurians FD-317 M1]
MTGIAVALDYALITPGKTTPLEGSTVVVDDTDREMIYEGNGWNTTTNEVTTCFDGCTHGLPLGNGTHKTRTVGDRLKFMFAGASIGVYGVFDWTATGSVSLDFTLDNQTISKDVIVPAGNNPLQETRNYEFFSATNLTADNHTLLINVTQSLGNQTFVFDFLTYQPSFNSLATKPNFTSSPSEIPPSPSFPPLQSTSTTALSHHNSYSGAIIGAKFGGVMTTFALLILVYWRRRTDRKQAYLSERPRIDPFILEAPTEPTRASVNPEMRTLKSHPWQLPEVRNIGGQAGPNASRYGRGQHTLITTDTEIRLRIEEQGREVNYPSEAPPDYSVNGNSRQVGEYRAILAGAIGGGHLSVTKQLSREIRYGALDVDETLMSPQTKTTCCKGKEKTVSRSQYRLSSIACEITSKIVIEADKRRKAVQFGDLDNNPRTIPPSRKRKPKFPPASLIGQVNNLHKFVLRRAEFAGSPKSSTSLPLLHVSPPIARSL